MSSNITDNTITVQSLGLTDEHVANIQTLVDYVLGLPEDYSQKLNVLFLNTPSEAL